MMKSPASILLGLFARLARLTAVGAASALMILAGIGAGASAAGPKEGGYAGGGLSAWASGLELRFRLTHRHINGTHYIWRLAPGGRADGVGHSMIDPMSLRGGFLLEENDVGSWRVAGDLLCIVWPKFFFGRERCFQVEIIGQARARFTGIGQAPSFVADWAKRQ